MVGISILMVTLILAIMVWGIFRCDHWHTVLVKENEEVIVGKCSHYPRKVYRQTYHCQDCCATLTEDWSIRRERAPDPMS